MVKAKAEGRTPPDQPWEQNLNNADMPTGLYNGMIAPLTPFPIAGVLWYQGESNASAERGPTYAAMLAAMIRDWRRAWGIESPDPFRRHSSRSFHHGSGNE